MWIVQRRKGPTTIGCAPLTYVVGGVLPEQAFRQDVFDYLLKTAEPSYVVECVKTALAARTRVLRQRTLLDVVGTAVQELRGGPQAAENESTRSAAPGSAIGAVMKSARASAHRLSSSHLPII